MQLRLPLVTPREASARTLVVGGRAYRLEVVRHRRARRYLLRVAADDTLRLTVPRGASIGDGLRFAAAQRAWIERERARHRRRSSPWTEGTVVWFRGREERLQIDGCRIRCGAENIALSGRDVRAAVEAHLRTLAARELPGRCQALAVRHGLEVARVTVRNQRSRWGSCSPRRVVSLNWRLVQMPEAVAEYILLHELMHLRQANHSRRFWREVGSVCPDWRACERWLRRHGREIL